MARLLLQIIWFLYLRDNPSVELMILVVAIWKIKGDYSDNMYIYIYYIYTYIYIIYIIYITIIYIYIYIIHMYI